MIRLSCIIAVACVAATTARADDQRLKSECLDNHGRGQDARDEGKLALARSLFLSCAQPACPELVRTDCARFADGLTRELPTVAFSARDTSGVDLLDTTVAVDGTQLLTRLDDGKAHELDPGKHVVRFTNGTRTREVTVLLNSGEKGRTIAVTFPVAGGAVPARSAPSSAERSAGPVATTHPLGAKALIIGGSAIAVVGLAIGIYGATQVPDACSIRSGQCLAAPGDPVFGEATTATRQFDVGIAVAAVGVGAALGGLIWYIARPTTQRAATPSLAAWASSGSAGISIFERW